jgi:PhnB protein
MAPTTKPKPIPDAYRRVTPCLVVQGGAKALEFYAEVFGATERMRFPGPGGTVAHAEIQIGDSVVIVEDESPEQGSKAPPPGGVAGSPSSLFIYVEDVDAVVAQAVELGATLQRPPQGSVLRRPGRVHRGPVRAWMDHRDARGGRGVGGDGASDGRAAGPGLAPIPLDRDWHPASTLHCAVGRLRQGACGP